MTEEGRTDELPFPGSLCHRCDAPPRYVRTRTSVFILCPRIPERYPRQPVMECPYFRARSRERRDTVPGTTRTGDAPA